MRPKKKAQRERKLRGGASPKRTQKKTSVYQSTTIAMAPTGKKGEKRGLARRENEKRRPQRELSRIRGCLNPAAKEGGKKKTISSATAKQGEKKKRRRISRWKRRIATSKERKAQI